ncbi:MAG: polysaccharide biosynthesis/export family protein [Phycisphaerae bacterium]|jgi:polysaccharide export outer membrane protein
MQNSRRPLCLGRISAAVKRARAVAIVFLSVISIYLGGCGNKFFDPMQVGRFRPVPAVNVILDSLGVAEEVPSVWVGAEDPKPVDVVAYETDYVFSPGDTVRISIFELLQEGTPYINDYSVTETGKISIPEVGVVEAAGLTEEQLEDEIKQILSPSLLKEPSVVVTLLNSQRRTFSIWGDGVPRPDRYAIPRYDFRLTDAIATAGGIRQFNVSFVYISRPVTGKETITEPVDTAVVEPEKSQEPIKPEKEQTAPQNDIDEPEKEMLEIVAPQAKHQRFPLSQSQGLVIASAEMITDEELAEAALPGGFKQLAVDEKAQVDAEGVQESPAEPAGGTTESPINEGEKGRIEWIFQDGRWVPIQVGRAKPAEPEVAAKPEKTAEPVKESLPEEFGWEEIGTGGVQARVIEIPADRLRSGDPRYNIVIRAGDSIHVPVDITGEYFIYGNVNYQGVVPMDGRPVTLKMAVAAAGGLGSLAWPKRCEVTRRIGRNKEETVMVDLDKIASGEQPDFFIKPLDLINVGTHSTARWRAVLRNSFRASYGFGFIYDRNFGETDVGTGRPFSSIYNHIF